MTAASTPTAPLISSRRRLGLAAVLLGMAGSVVMQTLLATAMPRIVTELGSPELYGWVFASYLIASTALIPLFGQLADRHGCRPLFLIGILGYAVGTALASLVGSMPWLVAARVIQGLGAGALVPAALASVAGLFEGKTKGRIFSAMGVVQVVANAVGPILGGWFTDGPGWRWGLWAVVPLAVISACCAAVGLPAATGEPWRQAWRHVDWIQPVRLWRADKHIRGTANATFLLGIVLMCATAYLPLLVQGLLSGSAGSSGLALVPLMVGVGIGSIVGGQTPARARRAISLGAWVAGGVAFTLMALVTSGRGGWAFAAIAAALAGIGVGTIQPILLISIQDDAPADVTAAVSGLIQLARNLGGAAGTSLLGLWLIALPLQPGLTALFVCLAGIGCLGALLNATHRS